MILFNGVELMSKGKRLASLHEASLKVLGRTRIWEQILGVGYKIEILNSLGESYVDKESQILLFDIFKHKNIDDAKDYINKLYKLRDDLIKEVNENNTKDFTDDFSTMMGYFFAIKSIFEIIYKESNPDDQKIIEDWRNDPSIFEPLKLYYKFYPEKDKETLKEWSWVYNNKKLFLEEKLISFSENPELSDIKIIKGNIAYPGFAKGIVRVILNTEDMVLMQDGEIIVAPMTTVDFLPIMKKASAFITNAGGITSHAAIVARELKKPCIVGTKIATKVLKDGDLVEVDADNGVVRILEK